MSERSDVTSGNWLDAPYNRLGFIRVPELARTEPISRGDGPVLELPRDERGLDSFSFEFEGEKISFSQMLESTFTDGLLVLHDGVVLFEYYAGAMVRHPPADVRVEVADLDALRRVRRARIRKAGRGRRRLRRRAARNCLGRLHGSAPAGYARGYAIGLRRR